MARADKALVARRVNDLLRIRLDGAERWDVCDYVRQKEAEEGSAWHVGKDGTPLSDSQIWRYLQRADQEIERSFERSRKRLIRRHVAQLRHLYARAATNGELSVARAILRDLAEIQRLMPNPADQLQRAVDDLTRRLHELEQNDGNKTHTTNFPGSRDAGDSGEAGGGPGAADSDQGAAAGGTACPPESGPGTSAV